MPEDRYVNTWYVTATDLTGGAMAALAASVRGFYTIDPSGAVAPVSNWLGLQADAIGNTVKIYNMADAPIRTPIYEDTATPGAFGASAATSLPQELAACLSYSADPAGGIPAAQRRGRMYIGPLNVNALQGSGSGDNHVNDSLMDSIVYAAQEFAIRCSQAGIDWSVYSPTRGAASKITSVWCDDAWDIQRRRGVKPSSRRTLPIGV